MGNSDDGNSKVFVVSILVGFLVLGFLVLVMFALFGVRMVPVGTPAGPPMMAQAVPITQATPTDSMVGESGVVPSGPNEHWFVLKLIHDEEDAATWMVNSEKKDLDVILGEIQEAVDSGKPTRLRIVVEDQSDSEAVDALVKQVRTLGVTSYEVHKGAGDSLAEPDATAPPDANLPPVPQLDRTES